MSRPARVGFVGNRYGSLSFAIYRGMRAAAAAVGTELVLIDSSSRRDASPFVRLRNRLVRTAKRILRNPNPTEVIDWYRRPEARTLPRRTPPGHDLNAPGFAETLADVGVGAILVAGCDQILRQPFLDAIPRVVNFHNSLLPSYRGVHAVQWAFLRRESVSGYTYHTIDSEQIDLGRVVIQESIPIEPDDTPALYSARLLRKAAEATRSVLDTLTAERWPPGGVALKGGSYFGRKAMAEARRFDPSLPVEESVHRDRVLGSLDLPVGARRFRISGLERGDESLADEPGRWRTSGTAIVIRCTDGAVRIRRIENLPAAWFAPLLPRVVPAAKVG